MGLLNTQKKHINIYITGMLITRSVLLCNGIRLLTSRAGPAPTSGDTFSSRGDVSGAGGQAHRRHPGVHLHWG